ncbi:MAG: tRNA (N6-isopentenyl adenosine(37)-C2)-methylthiotransferase MiaB [Peptostreptococcaceae bacterium]|nr:tRNA (N6-isopentenyl adenosine(37)-C2)-methylthiotransferase MiaB [Peptostreptococcaceae bacterium]
MSNKYHIITFGCQMNEHDSENIGGMLENIGYKNCDDKDSADIVIINTCSIREHADQRFYGVLGQLKKKKLNDPNYIVAVGGCMMQQEHIVETMKEKFPWVDIIFGTHNIEEFPGLLSTYMEKNKKITEILPDREEVPELLPSSRLYKYKSFVNITYGCNNFCTYCIVPYTRGREKSRTMDSVINEVKLLVADGVKEVTYLGQNVNSFKDPDGRDISDLIYETNKIDGLERIRFMTSHPKDLSDRLIQAYVDCDKLCNYIHLPIQSGSTEVLKRMNRKYDRDRYLDIVRKMKKAVPGITISTDIIVGFPGETEENFADTLSMINEVRYDSAFTFLYSIRKGTPAGKYDNQIPDEIKHERFNRLLENVNKITAEKNSEHVGRIEKVLVEGISKNNKSNLMGRTEGYKLVNFPGEESLVGEIISVKIINANTFSLEGEVL